MKIWKNVLLDQLSIYLVQQDIFTSKRDGSSRILRCDAIANRKSVCFGIKMSFNWSISEGGREKLRKRYTKFKHDIV